MSSDHEAAIAGRNIGPRRRIPLAALGVVVAAIVAAVVLLSSKEQSLPTGAAWKSGSAAGFNVLLFTLDTTRADHIGCYGHSGAETPVIDALAAQGTRYADAITPVPSTLPSHATILTGLNPHRHGVRYNGEYELAAEHEILAETLSGEGYQTGAFVSAFVIDARYGLSQGFDHYDGQMGMAPLHWHGDAFHHERLAELTSNAAITWLEARDSHRPFLAWVHYFSPHGPYTPPERFARRFPADPYDGEIAYMDSEMGRVIDALKKDGSFDRTLILVVGDHGEGLGDHGETTHAFLIYESVMRIPFVMSCPAIFPGPQIVDDAVVSTVDIVPTLLDLMGIENKRSLDGISLLAERDPDRRVYMESFSPYLEFGWAPLFAYRTHQAKYIFAPKPEYYDLQTDPGELDNLFVPGEGPWQALDNEMSAFLKSQPSLDSVAAAATPPDEAAGKMLQDLGYLGSDQERLADAKGLLRNPLDMLSVREALDRARGLMASGKRDEALDLGEKALRDAPESRRLQNMMANIYLEMKHFDKAEAALRKSIELNDRADAYYNLSQLLLKQQRLDEAEDILTEAEAQHATHGSLWISKGDLAARRGRGLEAIEHYKQAKALDAYRTGALAEARIKLIEDRMVERGAMWLARGDEMADQGRYEEAIEFYGRAKILDPQHSGTKAQSRIETVQRLMHKPDVDGQQENGE